MHPPLHKPHPQCEEYVRALLRCHEEHKVGKWFGKCNDAKAMIDWCFREEKVARRAENMRKAREFEERFEREKAAIMAKRQQERREDS